MSIIRSKFFIFSFVIAAVLCIVGTAAFTYYIFSGMPPVEDLEEYSPSLSTKVFDRNNNLIYEFSVEKRQLVPLEEIPVDIQNAVIAMEDRDFFNHAGFSIKGIFRALISDIILGKPAQGGSTLTQQLSRSIFLSNEKKITRKIREIFLAVQIEHSFSKQEILQLYLNQIYLGEGSYGVKAAAKKYFDKELSDLTLGESAMLVGIIPLPNRYNPFNSPQLAKERRAVVLNAMKETGYITAKEAEDAAKEPIPQRKVYGSRPGLYFIEYVRRMLEPKYGTEMFWKGGLNIYTTIDINEEAAAERIMNAKLREYDIKIAKNLGIEVVDKDIAEEDTGEDDQQQNQDNQKKQNKYPELQGAFMLRDVKTGAIRVMAGGRDYEESRFNRVTQAKRQPGSSFKPYVWMAALEKGYTPASLIKDLEIVFYYNGREWKAFDDAKDQYSMQMASQSFMYGKSFDIWAPKNYGGKSSGIVTMRRGLELSKNLVAVNLINAVGIDKAIDVAKRAGIQSSLTNAPALALGVSEVTMQEHLDALSTFANGGIRTDDYAVEKVVDRNGKVLEQHIPHEEAEFSPQDSFLLVNMMKGVVQRGTGGAARALGRPIAGKTGTSQNHRDMWFIGMTPDVAAAAWMGYDDDTFQKTANWTGGGTVAPWWTAIMSEILKGQPVTDFAVPEGISFAFINPDSGKLATPSDRRKFLESFKKGTEPGSF